jgi:two-component system sensor histidine kinase ChiS
MPGMTGDKFLSYVHENYSKPIKILLTGQAALESAISAVNNADLYRYLTKPWDEEDFLLTVEKGIMQYELMEETQRQVEVFQRFVPREFLEFLGKDSILDVGLGDQVQKEMTILFADIRSFTTLSEKMTPKENFDFINAYLSKVGPVIRDCHGFIDKYVGDALMALFPHRADDAVRASIGIHRAVDNYNVEFQKENSPPISIGIGLHTGNLMLGTIGNAERMQSTVISDAVNLTSRLEGLTRFYGASILISETTLSRIEDSSRYNYRLLGKVRVKGKNNAILVYEVFDGDPENIAELKLQTKSSFENGLELYYQQEFAEASVQFKNVLKINPEDKTARLYLEHSAQFMVKGVPTDWDGVEEVSEK